MSGLQPAALAFDTVAAAFDRRFGEWQSVAAQRRAVRRAMLEALPPGARVLEVGGGTGEDAAWLAGQGFRPFLTDASPSMVAVARGKLTPLGMEAEETAAEELEAFAARYLADGGKPFDAAFSNFAPLNCVDDLVPVSRGLAKLVRPGGSALLVLFGTFSPGDMLLEVMHRRPAQALRRLRRGPAPARLGARHFTVTYHRAGDVVEMMQPWFRLEKKIGVGIFVPPSAAEPWISAHPRLLGLLEALDRIAARPLARFGDHVLYQFTRSDLPPP